MGGIIKSTINGKSYYYAIETQRVNGEPRVVSKKYLGKFDDIVQKVTEPPKPTSIKKREFGLTAAIMGVAEKLGFVQLVDDVVLKRNQGASIGQYMLIAALNRCAAPTSKNKISEWYEETVLPRLMRIDNTQLTSQRFWDNMDLMTADEIVALQVHLAKKVIAAYDIDLRVLLYDATNFFTFIDTNNTCTLPQRGHNKQKRNDLRQISLSMIVSRDSGIPLTFDTYQGNESDSVEFDHFVEELIDRFNAIFGDCKDLTIVCDKGNNSKKTHKRLDGSPFHFVVSISSSQIKPVMDVPLDDYQDCQNPRLENQKYYHTREKVYGIERTVVSVFNPALLAGQLQGISHNLTKTQDALKELQIKLLAWKGASNKRGKRPKAVTVEKQIKRLLSREYMNKLICYTVKDVDDLWVDLQFMVDDAAFTELKSKKLGKTILITDRKDWTSEEIILAYRDQYKIEHDFRQMKDPSWVSWDPLFHWTDQKIRVHAFYCFAALLMSALLMRELKSKKINLSLPHVFEKLSKIEEVIIEYGSKRRSKKPVPQITMLTDMDKVQEKLYTVLELERYVKD